MLLNQYKLLFNEEEVEKIEKAILQYRSNTTSNQYVYITFKEDVPFNIKQTVKKKVTDTIATMMHNMGQEVHTYDLPNGNLKVSVRINEFTFIDTIKSFLVNVCNDFTNYEQGILVRRNDPATIAEKENKLLKK